MLTVNMTVYLVEKDIYARYAINSYLGWDRRTRVTHQFSNLEALEAQLSEAPYAELPDTILLDGLLMPTPQMAENAMQRIYRHHPAAHVLVLAHDARREIGQAVRASKGNGYLLREETGLQLSWLVVWAREHDYPFIVTPSTAPFFDDGAIIPSSREYPDLTERIRQALLLCVIEGMSAELAADEMGLSPHTIRTYIKEGYSILEAGDQTEYPAHLSPQEKAFMRLTALDLDLLEEKIRHSRGGEA